MNSYNDNLHSTVVSSLLNQELNLKAVESQANAAMFTLYHAEAATITAEENLETATDDMNKKLVVNNQAVTGVNISTNLLSAATQASTYLKQSVTNTAVCAANVQIATNAVLKLAGDMGNIYSIVHAADYKSDIYDTTAEARTLMNETAYLAEVASDLSMQASILTAEVPGTDVLNKAKSSNTSLGNLYSITTNDFNNAAQLVTTDTNNLSAASVAEKAAEGEYEDVSVEVKATTDAYKLMNAELNLNLRVSEPTPLKDLTAKAKADKETVRNIRFHFIRSPFRWEIPAGAPVTYPVQNYYLIAVKDSAKTTFSIAAAENIVQNGAGDANPKFITVPAESFLFREVQEKAMHGEPITAKVQETLLKPVHKSGATIHIHPNGVNMDVDFFDIANTGKTLCDSDGDAMKLGTRYVIFVYAQYLESYKKKINNFDDYLSAASLPFTMYKTLEAVVANQIKVTEGMNSSVTFKIQKTPEYPVQYRCMFLPYETDMPKDMLNKLSLAAMMEEALQIQAIADLYDPQIAIEQVKLLKPDLKTDEKTKLETALNTLQAAKNAAINDATTLSGAALKLTKLTAVSRDIDFLFNLVLAEQVSPGNYITQDVNPPGTSQIAAQKEFTLKIDEEVTDIFGTLLQENIKYLPVVLSAYNGAAEDAAMYQNSWSGYEHSPVYTHKTAPPAPHRIIPTKKK